MKLISVVLLFVFLAGCHHQYRVLDDRLYPMKPLAPRRQVPIPLPMIEHTATPAGAGETFDTAYIEFRENGCMFDPAGVPEAGLKYQLDETRKLIRDKRPSQVVLYVHGWNNNSSEQSADVARFRFALSFLSAKLNPSGPLLGIFIGWRGGTFKGGSLGPFTFITYWARKQGAKRVAEGNCKTAAEGLPGVLNELIKETSKANEQRHFYAIGHSFGARVLEGALEESDYAKGIFEAIQHHPNEPYVLPVDLVLLINPATDSMKTENFIDKAKRLVAAGGSDFIIRHPGYSEELCKADPADRRCKPYPLMVEMSSVGDFLTGFVLPVANLVNFAPPFLFMAAPSARLLSAPFTPWLRTHTVTSCDGKASGEESCGVPGVNTEFDFQLPVSPPQGPSKDLAWERVERIPSAKQDWIWIMKVDTKVSLNHGDVWNGNVAEMMFALIDPDGPSRNYAGGQPPQPPNLAAVAGQTKPAASAASGSVEPRRPTMVPAARKSTP